MSVCIGNSRTTTDDAWCTSSANATKQLLLSLSLLAHRCTCAHFPRIPAVWQRRRPSGRFKNGIYRFRNMPDSCRQNRNLYKVALGNNVPLLPSPQHCGGRRQRTTYSELGSASSLPTARWTVSRYPCLNVWPIGHGRNRPCHSKNFSLRLTNNTNWLPAARLPRHGGIRRFPPGTIRCIDSRSTPQGKIFLGFSVGCKDNTLNGRSASTARPRWHCRPSPSESTRARRRVSRAWSLRDFRRRK